MPEKWWKIFSAGFATNNCDVGPRGHSLAAYSYVPWFHLSKKKVGVREKSLNWKIVVMENLNFCVEQKNASKTNSRKIY